MISADKGDTAAANSAAGAYLKAANFDYAVLGIVIALMGFKPASSHVVLLGALSAIFLAAAVCFLTPAVRRYSSGAA